VIGSVIGNADDGTTGVGKQLLHEGNKLPGVRLLCPVHSARALNSGNALLKVTLQFLRILLYKEG
jgi:hypothetical protein